MIEVCFTIDYEIYGNGAGSLLELVYEPTKRLTQLFQRSGARFVCFVEAAEFEMIEGQQSDSGIKEVRQQIRDLYEDGFEIALHLHPQWYNGRWEAGHWILDYSEYNLCTLPRERISDVVQRARAYLRDVVGDADFSPRSFRAGNWLFQPSRQAAAVLAENGVEVDSSVFKGGVQQKYRLDYRPALKNGPWWNFADDVNVADSSGALIEIPIHSVMVPFWRMFSSKRIGLQKKGAAAGRGGAARFARVRDFWRLRQPLKFDFCRMTLSELIELTERAIVEDEKQPNRYFPLVAIGHSKDLVDYQTIESFLSYLARNGIGVCTLDRANARCRASIPGGDKIRSDVDRKG